MSSQEDRPCSHLLLNPTRPLPRPTQEVPPEPVVFLKASSTVRGLGSGPLAFADEEFHHEAELVLLVGAEIPQGSSTTGDLMLNAVRGVGLGLDLTRRQEQAKLKEKRLPWCLSKSFAGSALVGDFLAEGYDMRDLGYTLHVGGELRQEAHVSNMIFPVPSLLRYLTRSHTLVPGDLIFTGTPKGVGPIRRGDEFHLTFVSGATGTFHGVL